MPKGDMHHANMQSNDGPYPENEENFPIDHPRNDDMPHETWRTYNEHPPPNMDMPSNNDMHSENGAFHHNPDMRHNFEPHNNIGPSTRGRHDRYPPNSLRGEEEYISENIPPRGGPPQYGDDMFQGSDMDSRNNHMGPGPEEMSYMSHKRSWNDGPGREDNYPQSRDYDGPPPNFNPRSRMRSQMFHGPRGPRMNYRGRSPYRVVNRGRNRGGYAN